jgi:hypothetical protein
MIQYKYSYELICKHFVPVQHSDSKLMLPKFKYFINIDNRHVDGLPLTIKTSLPSRY